MNRIVTVTAGGLCLLLMSGRGPVVAQQGAAAASSHIVSTAAELKWGEAPPVLPKGAKMAVLSGDPGQAGPFAVRLRMPAGYRIAPHWHPTDEHVTVIAGTFSMGMGDKFDAKALKALPAGGYALMPAQPRHYATTRGGATVQVHGTGPFQITYVNPADDPSKSGAK
jgi:quercetin dioxygenase-like cupin family protein